MDAASLPEEMQEQIITEVPLYLLSPVSLVCKLWRRFALKKTTIIDTLDKFEVACSEGDYLSIVFSPIDKYWVLEGLRYCRWSKEGICVDIAVWLIKRNANPGNHIYIACLYAFRRLIDIIIEKGGQSTNWDEGLMGACEGGHVDLVELMISKKATNWNFGLLGACKGNNLLIAEYMILKGADNLNEAYTIASNLGYDELALYLQALLNGETSI